MHDAPLRTPPRSCRRPARRRRTLAAALSTLLLGACGAPPPPPAPDPAIDGDRVATVLQAATRLQHPTRIVFRWSLDDRDLRLDGRGVARVEPPYRARLDLFLGNGETVVAAALVGHDLRLPPGAPQGIIPPPDLLWATLGVFHPDPNAALLGADAPEAERVRLRYGAPGGIRLHYTVAGPRIHQVELLRDGSTVQRVAVDVADGAERTPHRAVYRDLAAFRELTITRESVEQVEAYPADIWTVG